MRFSTISIFLKASLTLFTLCYQRLLCDHHFVLPACRYHAPYIASPGVLRCLFYEPFCSSGGWICLIPYPYVFPFDRHICPSPIAILHGVRRRLFIPMSVRHESRNCMIISCPFHRFCRNVYNRQFSRLLHILLHRYMLYRGCWDMYWICRCALRWHRGLDRLLDHWVICSRHCPF